MKLIDINELSFILKITTQTLRNKISRREPLPPSFKLPGCRRRYWNLCDVEAWLEKYLIKNDSDFVESTTKKRGRPSKKCSVLRRKQGEINE